MCAVITAHWAWHASADRGVTAGSGAPGGVPHEEVLDDVAALTGDTPRVRSTDLYRSLQARAWTDCRFSVRTSAGGRLERLRASQLGGALLSRFNCAAHRGHLQRRQSHRGSRTALLSLHDGKA